MTTLKTITLLTSNPITLKKVKNFILSSWPHLGKYTLWPWHSGSSTALNARKQTQVMNWQILVVLAWCDKRWQKLVLTPDSVFWHCHYSIVIMSVMVSQITGILIVLLSHLFRHKSKKTSKLCVTGLCEGNPPVDSPHKGPVMQKMFPSDYIIMKMYVLHQQTPNTKCYEANLGIVQLSYCRSATGHFHQQITISFKWLGIFPALLVIHSWTNNPLKHENFSSGVALIQSSPDKHLWSVNLSKNIFTIYLQLFLGDRWVH